uniref:PAP21-like protein n=1 Tax=Ascaris suum TaxID=6253 RepID=F1LCI7_ASCSU
MEKRLRFSAKLRTTASLLPLIFLSSIDCIMSLDAGDRPSLGKALFFYIEKPRTLAYTYEVRSSEEIGAPFPQNPQKNIPLQYANPAHACTKIQPTHGNVVLIERGECSFAKKALMASMAGARFALITDSAAGTDDWIDMVGDGTAQKSDIPVAYLPGVSGRRIREHLMYGDERITVTIPLNYTSMLLSDIPRKPPWELW